MTTVAAQSAVSTGTYMPGVLEALLESRRKGPLRMLMDIWRQHGDLTHMRFGRQPFFLVVHPEHVRLISVTRRQNYDKFASYNIVRELLLGDGVVTAVGESWRWQRRLMAPFFTPRGLERYYPIMVADAQRFVQRWQARTQPTQQVDMFEEMAQVTAAIIVRTIFSTASEETMRELKWAVETMIRFTSERDSSLVRLPMWVPTPEHLGYQRARQLTHRYVQQLIAQRRALPTDQWPEDVLTKLLTARDEETGATVSDQLLLDNGITLFVAGHETTARTLSFLWYALSQNPEVEARLHAEVDAVLGEAPPTLEDLKRLPYTLRVVKEALRLYPAAPMYVRDAQADDELDGVRIPAGSHMLLFPYATHRHPDFWPEPERFDPERWRPELEAARDPHAYHPFAAGQRICLGNNFSLLETHLLTAMLARRFKARLVPGFQPQIEALGVLGSRNGMRMLIQPR
jgi:cytochrome P450